MLIRDTAIRLQLAEQTRYSHIVKAAPALIVVFLDTREVYNEVKDHQAAGACIQNMLLATEELGLGAVWLGEILNRQEQVKQIIGISDEYDLMAIIAIGHPITTNPSSKLKEIKKEDLQNYPQVALMNAMIGFKIINMDNIQNIIKGK
mgnify:CR=1 FL=1